MSQTAKVFFACAIGAFIGAVVALQINHHFWWVGLMVGFASGYLAYQSEQVVGAIPLAWRQTTSWRPDKVWWRSRYRNSMDVTGTRLTVMGVPFLMITALVTLFSRGQPYSVKAGVLFSLATVFVCVALSFFLLGDTELQRASLSPLRTYFLVLPKFLLWTIPKHTPKVAPTVFRWIGHVVKTTMKFFGKLIYLVHSEIRLLCGMDAAIGAAVGYCLHNAILGALIGGLWGVLNFEVLSIRILKLVPKTQSILRR